MASTPGRTRRRAGATPAPQENPRKHLSRRESWSEGEPPGLDDSASESENVKVKLPGVVKVRTVLTRTLAACCMSVATLLMLQAGHLYCILVGVVTQFELYRELVNVRYVEAKERKMPWFRTLQWLWFLVAMIFVYGENLRDFCVARRPPNDFLYKVTENIEVISFCMYCVTFVASVLTLKVGMVRFQISQFMWSIVTILLVVFQCKFFARNTLNGLFWFFFPMATVIMNDVSAYFCGITMGRRFIRAPFLALSPNKTWEGFVGAAVLTIIFSFFFPALLSRWTWFTCPQPEISLSLFQKALTCTPHAVFVPRDFSLPVLPFVGPSLRFTLYPIQLHGLAYGLFASLVAPFGGFFASAIKRAYRLKDFDSFVPGHGGMMDRMDCHLIMMGFTSLHYQHFVSGLGSIDAARNAFLQLAAQDQRALLLELTRLAGVGRSS